MGRELLGRARARPDRRHRLLTVRRRARRAPRGRRWPPRHRRIPPRRGLSRSRVRRRHAGHAARAGARPPGARHRARRSSAARGRTFRSFEEDCDSAGENCTENEPGPCHVVAEFADVRAPTITAIAGPAANTVAFNDARRQTFGYTTDEDDEAPAFQCPDASVAFTQKVCTPSTIASKSVGSCTRRMRPRRAGARRSPRLR
jgi:hypothetical protein